MRFWEKEASVGLHNVSVEYNAVNHSSSNCQSENLIFSTGSARVRADFRKRQIRVRSLIHAFRKSGVHV